MALCAAVLDDVLGEEQQIKKQRVGFSLVTTRAMQKNWIPRLGRKQIKKISVVVEGVSGLTEGGAIVNPFPFCPPS